MAPRRRLVALVGPTAAGKTDLSVEIAHSCAARVEIVSLDSRQLYRGLDRGTGKPSAAQRRAVPHWLVDLLDPDQRFDAGRYRREVERLLPDLWQRGVVPLLVGGAGFYLRALAEGFFELPADGDALAALRQEHASLSLEELSRRLAEIDPESASTLHRNDRYRIERALELQRLTGRPLSQLKQEFEPRPVLDCELRVLHLSPPRAVLHERIEGRTRRWIGEGWRLEVEALLQAGYAPDCPGLSILGYREIVAWIQGTLAREQAFERILVSTRRYARQQEIWFRKALVVERGPGGAALGDKLRDELEAAAVEGRAL